MKGWFGCLANITLNSSTDDSLTGRWIGLGKTNKKYVNIYPPSHIKLDGSGKHAGGGLDIRRGGRLNLCIKDHPLFCDRGGISRQDLLYQGLSPGWGFQGTQGKYDKQRYNCLTHYPLVKGLCQTSIGYLCIELHQVR